jgi:hypothetical protein
LRIVSNVDVVDARQSQAQLIDAAATDAATSLLVGVDLETAAGVTVVACLKVLESLDAPGSLQNPAAAEAFRGTCQKKFPLAVWK